MARTRRTRPVLATVISLWEVSVVVLAVAAHIAVRVRHQAYDTPYQAAQSASHTVPASPLHIPGLILGYALAIAGAVALWQMRRSAFVFFTARVVIALAVPLLAPASHTVTIDSLVPVFLFIVDSFALVLNTAIAWYAYDVTKPRRRTHRRRRTSRSYPLPESEPTRESNPEPTLATQDAPLTTSQFYLSADHQKTIRKD